jgi:hypothetical protein
LEHLSWNLSEKSRMKWDLKRDEIYPTLFYF